MKIQKFQIVAVILTLLSFGVAARAQTSAFTYQGRLIQNGTPQTGNFDFEFRLIDELGAIIALQPSPGVLVTNGVFNVPLDFGVGAFPGPARSLEIAVRPVGGPTFTTLLPRQPINSSPYAIKSLLSATADNSLKLGGIASTRFVQQDASGNVSVSGNLSVAGAATYNTVNAASQYNLGGQRIIGIGGQIAGSSFFAGVGAGAVNSNSFGGSANTFVGNYAGALNDSGQLNSFFGFRAGEKNTGGQSNAFFGARAGSKNTFANQNAIFGSDAGVNNDANQVSFFGASAGFNNTTGYYNSFFGAGAGGSNMTGVENSFFGAAAGRNNIASNNSFFGSSAGFANVTGFDNAFFGINAGMSNTTGNSNTYLGASAGTANQTGIGNTFVGTGTGAANVVGHKNSFFGNAAGLNSTGSFNVIIGSNAGQENTTGSGNTFVGTESGAVNVIGANNSFFGHASGSRGTTGSNNSFFGVRAGDVNTASDNSFFGFGSGKMTTTGDRNAFFGVNAGLRTTTGCCNSFFGNNVGASNTTGYANAFFGGSTGGSNTVGASNSYFGDLAGASISSGDNNTLVGRAAGASITTGNDITLAGGGSAAANNLTNANAFGANSFVSASNSLILGGISGINGATADTNVGIGTTAPMTRFQVRTTTGNYGITHTDGSITVGSYLGNSSSGAFGGWLGTQSNHKLFFFTNNGQPALTVDTTNNVGIGTTSPASKLAVAGVIESTTGGVRFPDGTVQTTAGVGTAVTTLNTLNGNVTLAAGSNITITPVGNTLTVASTASAVNAILNQTTPQAAANFNIAGNGTVGGTLTANDVQAAGSGFVLGNFGIGTAAPLAKLDVTGGNILIASAGRGVILKSPDGNTCRLLSVDDAGVFALITIVCP